MAKDNRQSADPVLSDTDRASLEQIEEFKTGPDVPRDAGAPSPTEELRKIAASGSPVLKEKARDKLYEMAATWAMQMELGEYVDAAGVRWDPKRFVMTEILRRLGYSESYIERGSRPAWFPGMGDFARYVAYLKAVREVNYTQGYDATKPLVETLFVAATVEIADRLMDPRKRKTVAMRELTDLFTKMHRAFAISSHGQAPPLAPGDMSKGGTIVYQNITNVIGQLPEGPARDKAWSIFQQAMREGAESLPSPRPIAVSAPSSEVEKQEVAS
jgi:hypothetical protein